MIRRSRQRLRHPPIKHSPQRPDVFSQSSRWSDHLLPGSIGESAEEEKSINRFFIVAIMAAAAFLFAVLAVQLVWLQVVEGDRLRGIAEGNRVREKVTFAPRGRILDRNGKVLAENTASFQLTVTPYQLPESKQRRTEMYRRVSSRLENTSPADIADTVADEGVSHPRPVLVRQDISHRTALRLEYILPEVDGFRLSSVPHRRYVSEAGLSHILGYVGRVSEEDVARRPDLNPLGFIGKRGVESAFDERLRGRNGVVETEVDARGRPLRTLRERSTRPGDDVRLTIDYSLQKRLASAIRKQMKEANVTRGAGIITHPDTGEILAMVSLPAYDNNAFSGGIGKERYRQILNNPAQPMLNRAVAAGYPSGSVIKPIVLLGALDSGTVTEDTVIHDRGRLTVQSQYDPSVTYTFEGWDTSGLGAMDARRAIAMSSNIYFYTVAGGDNNFNGMGIDNLVKYYRMFGLGSAPGIELPEETEGRVPTPAWKEEQTGTSWFTGDTYNLAIGQGDLQVSPLQMVRAHGAIANGGQLMKPQLRKGETPEVTAEPDIADKYYRIVQEGMRAVVSGGGTTSPAVFADVGVPVAGKSGTAETNPGVRDSHAWYSAYAPFDDPEIQGVVLLEEGEGGSQYAAPVLADVFETYFQSSD